MELPAQSDPCPCQDPVMRRVQELYRELIAHDGFGELRLDVRILKRRQKEVIITCGKQYRYVVDPPVVEQETVGSEAEQESMDDVARNP